MDTRNSHPRTGPSEGARRRRRDEESSRGWICKRDTVISLPSMLLLLLLLPLMPLEAENTPASETGCPQEVSVSIFSPMQGDVVSEGVSLLSFEVTAKRKDGGEGIPWPHVMIELDGQKLETSMPDHVGQLTLDGLSDGVHSIRVSASCGGRSIEGGSREVSFLYANPVEDEHDLADALLSWARTEEYRERVELMEGAMRQFAAANAEAMAEMQARMDALQEAAFSCPQARS